MVIYPYKKASHSARELAKALGCKLLYFPKRGPALNWGNPDYPENPIRIVNDPKAVAIAGNKLRTFEQWKDLCTVPWTTDRQVAQGWVDRGNTVFGRSMLRSHSGHGIIICEPKQKISHACPLYTQYVKKAKEFRVHVFNGAVIDVQEKRKSRGEADTSLVRSHENGYVFCRDGITESKGLRELATTAVRSLGLDFGAVDIIWNKKEDKNYLLEVNTAPGIEGTTLERYINAIKAYFGPSTYVRQPHTTRKQVHVGLARRR